MEVPGDRRGAGGQWSSDALQQNPYLLFSAWIDWRGTARTVHNDPQHATAVHVSTKTVRKTPWGSDIHMCNPVSTGSEVDPLRFHTGHMWQESGRIRKIPWRKVLQHDWFGGWIIGRLHRSRGGLNVARNQEQDAWSHPLLTCHTTVQRATDALIQVWEILQTTIHYPIIRNM